MAANHVRVANRNESLNIKLKTKLVDLEESFQAHVYHEFLNYYDELLLAGWLIQVVDQSRGRCYAHRKTITIPAFVFNRSEEYWIYYLAHEMAHARHSVYYIVGDEPHGKEFMRHFKLLCPRHLQHFELEYKPANAFYAGIVPEDF